MSPRRTWGSSSGSVMPVAIAWATTRSVAASAAALGSCAQRI